MFKSVLAGKKMFSKKLKYPDCPPVLQISTGIWNLTSEKP